MLHHPCPLTNLEVKVTDLELALVAQSDARDQEVMVLIQVGSGNILVMEIDHEIFSLIIFPLLLIQEGQLSVYVKKKCAQVLVNRLED